MKNLRKHLIFIAKFDLLDPDSGGDLNARIHPDPEHCFALNLLRSQSLLKTIQIQ